MTRRTKIRWRDLAPLLLDPKLQAFIDEQGRAYAARCGDGYVYRPPERNEARARGVVVTDTIRARYDNAKRLTLIRRLHG